MVRGFNFFTNRVEIEMKFNKIVGVFLLCGLSSLANAEDLKFANNTKYNLSFSIRNVCSTELGNIDKRTIKIINENLFDEACKHNPSQCLVDVYNNVGCTGAMVGNIIFDKRSITSVATQGIIMANGENGNVFFSEI